MIIKSSTPESCGVSSSHITEYIKMLERRHLAMHSILIARGDNIISETYYSPYRKDSRHRLYSVTKSFVALAVGFALEDGLLSLDDPMSKYFSKELSVLGDENENEFGLHTQTVRNMMMMATAKKVQNWFIPRSPDRVQFYFSNPTPAHRPGEFFDYDSTGTFVIGALVERLTGKTLMEYLREKLFNKIGVSDLPFALQCPGGHTWGDSAFLMPAADLFRVARFVLNGGKWNGEQILSADYIKEATSSLISTGDGKKIDQNGYGYYIWKGYGDSFHFNGMGCQFAFCIPETDLILVCTADNQGIADAADVILDGFYNMISKRAADGALPENPAAQAELNELSASLKLFAMYGEKTSPLSKKVSGKTYTLTENPMKIKWVSLTFGGEGGVFAWENAQGKKEIPFGLCENTFADFPQEGYSDRVGSVPGDRLLAGAYSGAWREDTEFRLKVQIIDIHLGNMEAVFSFSEEGDKLHLTMTKTAEDFLNEYVGEAYGQAL